LSRIRGIALTCEQRRQKAVRTVSNPVPQPWQAFANVNVNVHGLVSKVSAVKTPGSDRQTPASSVSATVTIIEASRGSHGIQEFADFQL
jgi:hypothetical protein